MLGTWCAPLAEEPAHNLTLDFSKAVTTIVYPAILDFFQTFNFHVIPGPKLAVGYPPL